MTSLARCMRFACLFALACSHESQSSHLSESSSPDEQDEACMLQFASRVKSNRSLLSELNKGSVHAAIPDIAGEASEERTLCLVLICTLLVACPIILYTKQSGQRIDLLTLTIASLIGLVFLFGSLVPLLGGTGPSNVFSWHIALMGPAWCTFVPYGLWAYTTGDLHHAEKKDRRNVHLCCMALAMVFSLVGMACICKAKLDEGKSQLGGLELQEGRLVLTRGIARCVHVLIGYVVMIAGIAQAVCGFVKRHYLVTQQVKTFSWHGKFGRLLVAAGLVPPLIGVWIHWNSAGGWSVQTRIIVTLMIAYLLYAGGTPTYPCEK